MKFVKYIYAILLLTLFAIVSIGCEEEQVERDVVKIEETEQQKPERVTYTVMYYASGGGAVDAMEGRGLDTAIEMSIAYFERRPLVNNVKFTACVLYFV